MQTPRISTDYECPKISAPLQPRESPHSNVASDMKPLCGWFISLKWHICIDIDIDIDIFAQFYVNNSTVCLNQFLEINELFGISFAQLAINLRYTSSLSIVKTLPSLGLWFIHLNDLALKDVRSLKLNLMSNTPTHPTI